MFVRHPDATTNLLPNGHVVLSRDKTDWAFTITPLGALVWEYCDGQHSPAQIVQEIRSLSQEFESVELETAVDQLLVELEDVGLVLEPE